MSGFAYLYVMISETDTGVGKLIRRFSHYPYNHVSITMDPSFRVWYSFARYFAHAPFFSGFLREPVERFLAKGYRVPVRIFRVEIPRDRARKLTKLFDQAGSPDTGLQYNYYDALAAAFGKKINIPGSYTCLSFACAVLNKDYLTIEALSEDLQDFLCYEGDLAELAPDSGSRSDPYFAPLGRFRCFWASARSIATVTYRWATGTSDDLVEERLHSTAF